MGRKSRFAVSTSVSFKAADQAASQSGRKSRRTEKSDCLAMEKTNQIVFLSLLAAGSLLLGKASPALSGDAAEESGGQRSSRAAHRGASPATELIAAGRPGRTVSAVDNDPDRSHAPTAGELVGAVVANELMDREKRRKWICMIENERGSKP